MTIILGGLLITAIIISYVGCVVASCALSAAIFLDFFNNGGLFVVAYLTFIGVTATVVTYFWSLVGVF